MYNTKVIKRSRFKLLLIPVVVIAGLIVLYVLEIKGVTNFYSPTKQHQTNSNTSDVVTSAKPTNTVDYSPAKDTDNVPIPDKNTDNTQTNPNPDNLSAVITSTRKSSDGSNYLIKVGVSGTDSGTCSATLSKDEVRVSATSEISLLGGQYGCNNLSVPMDSLSEGKWFVEVEVTNGQSKASVTSEVII